MSTVEPLVKVDRLRKLFPLNRGLFRESVSYIHAVDDISFAIPPGESLGLVGESGSGKTTTGKLLVRLLDPTDGNIYLKTDGAQIDIAHIKGRDMKLFRRQVQMIFQDPYESLNPRRTIFDTVAEPLAVQGIGNVFEREERVAELLALVGLAPPSTFIFRYPHELSGGQRQRVAIARALVIEPKFVVADEPTSMLDVSIRTGIMLLMQELAQRLGVTYLYITHDLAVARYMSGSLAVMYLGKIIEMGNTEELLSRPLHPYTKALLSSIPTMEPSKHRDRIVLEGDVPSPADPPSGCRFRTRCWKAQPICAEEEPALIDRGHGHPSACHFAEILKPLDVVETAS